MRVLGVDPGLTRCGVAVVDAMQIRSPQFVKAGVIRTPADMDHAFRLLNISDGIEEWIETYHPDVVSVERVFAQHNLSTVAGTTQAAGIAMVNAARRNIPVFLHTPSEVKAAITGSGSADKKQVGFMVSRILGLAEAPKPADAADAVALALCQLWRGTTVNRYAALVEQYRNGQTK